MNVFGWEKQKEEVQQDFVSTYVSKMTIIFPAWQEIQNMESTQCK